jgi:CRISPR-associated endoribonuclease Cas6
MSFIKKGYSKIYPNQFDEMYSKPNMKSFCFAVQTGKCKLDKDCFEMENNIISVIISVLDYPTFIQIYNAVQLQLNNQFKISCQNEIILKDISITMPKIISKNQVTIKFLSPLITRIHKDDNTDFYLDYSMKNFNEILNNNLEKQAKELNFLNVNDLKIELVPIKPSRTVVEAWGRKYNSSLGTYRLIGEERLINYIYQSGLGSRRSQGFGLFEIID